MPAAYDSDDNWYFSTFEGDWYLTPKVRSRLERAVRVEQRQTSDEWRKWATLIIATVALVISVASFWVRHKEPDPCPRNYYRSDSGECAFALAKPSSGPQVPQSAVPTPTTSSNPKKP